MSANSIKVFSVKKAILLCLGVGLLTAGLSVFLQPQIQMLQGFQTVSPNPIVVVSIPAISPTVTATTTSSSTPKTLSVGSSFEVPGKPLRLIIPAIGLNAAIQSVGLSWHNDGSMGVPTNFTDVGWYNKGPMPGIPGSSVIDGHLDGKKVEKAVFYDLSKLKPGDLVEVETKDGKTLQFQVIESKIYNYDAPATDVFTSSDQKAHLNLITCAGVWIKNHSIYNERVVVFTNLITN